MPEKNGFVNRLIKKPPGHSSGKLCQNNDVSGWFSSFSFAHVGCGGGLLGQDRDRKLVAVGPLEA